MTNCSKKESDSCLKDLKLLITQWDVQQRIRQKIQTWSIRYNFPKITKLPIKFIEEIILYFLLNHFRTAFTAYTQDSLMRIAHSLKCHYNQLAVNVFRKDQFFEYTLVIAAKLVHYLLDSRFANLKAGQGIEGQLYQGLVSLLIGYEVDSKAYDIILGKLKKPSCSHQRKESFKLLNDLKQCLDGFQKGISSAKKMHRKGFHNMPPSNDDKGLQSFRLQVQQALHTKKPITTQKQRATKRIEKKQPQKIVHTDWTKGKNKLININQVSSALAVCKGMQSHSKSTANIHLSRKRQLKQSSYYLQPTNNKEAIKAIIPLCQIIFNNNSKKNWGQVVTALKRTSDRISPQNEHKNNMSQSNFFILPKSTLKQSKNQSPAQKAQSLIEQTIPNFHSVPPSIDESIRFSAVNSPTQKQLPIRQQSTTFFLRDKQLFQTNCQRRQAKFQTKSIYFPIIKQ